MESIGALLGEERRLMSGLKAIKPKRTKRTMKTFSGWDGNAVRLSSMMAIFRWLHLLVCEGTAIGQRQILTKRAPEDRSHQVGVLDNRLNYWPRIE